MSLHQLIGLLIIKSILSHMALFQFSTFEFLWAIVEIDESAIEIHEPDGLCRIIQLDHSYAATFASQRILQAATCWLLPR